MLMTVVEERNLDWRVNWKLCLSAWFLLRSDTSVQWLHHYYACRSCVHFVPSPINKTPRYRASPLLVRQEPTILFPLNNHSPTCPFFLFPPVRPHCLHQPPHSWHIRMSSCTYWTCELPLPCHNNWLSRLYCFLICFLHAPTITT